MTKYQKELLTTLSKEQLIYLIEQMHHSLFLISEVCVEESKCHIDSKDAIQRIRDYIYDMPSAYNEINLKAELDMKMGKITPQEYRKILGLD